MDSTSNAGDFSPGELPRMSSAASLKAAEPQVQAEEVLSQPVQHGADGEKSKPGIFAQQDLALDSPEATTAGAQADIKEDGNLSFDDVRENVRKARSDLFPGRQRVLDPFMQPYGPRLSAEEMKERGPDHARMASDYTKELEYRVGILEQGLQYLQYEVRSKEGVVSKGKDVEEERQVMRDVPNI